MVCMMVSIVPPCICACVKLNCRKEQGHPKYYKTKQLLKKENRRHGLQESGLQITTNLTLKNADTRRCSMLAYSNAHLREKRHTRLVLGV